MFGKKAVVNALRHSVLTEKYGEKMKEFVRVRVRVLLVITLRYDLVLLQTYRNTIMY